MSQICLTELGATPQTPPVNKVRIYVGSDGILRSVDDAGAVTTYQPGGVTTNFLQYTNSSTFTTNSTSGVAIPMDTDRSSFASTSFTKTSSTDFRTDYNGQVIANFEVSAFPDSNDRGYNVFINKNGIDIDWTRKYSYGKKRFDRAASVSCNVILDCLSGDLFQFRIASNDGDLIQTSTDRSIGSLRFLRAI